MKKKKINLIISIGISLILLACICVMIVKIYSGTSNSIRSANHFLKGLSEVGAINKSDIPEKENLKEIAISTEVNSNTKYTVVGSSYGMDLDENYEVIGFTDVNVGWKSQTKIISQEDAIRYASKYLDKIITDKFKFKEIKESSDEKLPYYTICFYKYHKDYLCLDYEILLNINKYDGKLVGYSGVNDEKLEYNSDIELNIDKARDVAKEYFDMLKIDGELEYSSMLGYVNLGEGKSQLAYLLKFNIQYNDRNQTYDIYISAKDGKIIKENVDSDVIGINE